jgi:phenylacetate-CoA ligase
LSAATGYWLARETRGTLAVLRWGRGRIQDVADARLARVIRTAAGAPHFRTRLVESGIDPAELRAIEPGAVLRALTPVDKRALREAGTGALVGGRVGAGWHWSLSSGSTGEPFRTYFDARSWAILKYLIKLRSRIANGMRATDRVAILDAIPPDQEGTTALERAGRVRRVSVFRTGASQAERLSKFRPRAVYGLATALLEVADALKGSGRPLHVPLVFTSGEVLVPATRKTLEAAFQARVLDIYGSTEMKEVAWECLAGGMHLNADVVRLEVLAPDGEASPPGVEGDIVVTSLVNAAMPLIRFRIGDRGILSEGRCGCGVALPLIGVVTGREAEMLDLGGDRLSPYVLTSALEQVRGLVRYQVLQMAPTSLSVKAVLAEGVDPEAAAVEVRRVIARAVSSPLEVEVGFVDRLYSGPGGKTRVVQALTSAPQENER